MALGRASTAALVLVLSACVTTQVTGQAVFNNRRCADELALGNLDAAELFCDHGLEFAPLWADLWVNKGLIAMQRGQRERAKAAFIRAVHANPESAQAWNNLGALALEAGSWSEARVRFERALKVNPDYAEARNNLALTYYRQGQAEDARKHWRLLALTHPDLAAPHHDLAVLALQSGDSAGAVRDASRAVALDPSFADAWRLIAVAQALQGHDAEAREALTACRDAAKDRADAECAIPSAPNAY